MNIKYFILSFCIVILPLVIHANENDSLLNILDKSLDNQSFYIQKKENSLSELKKELIKSETKEEQFHLLEQIMDEYSYFMSDSALYYSKRCLDLAIELKNSNYELDIRLERAYLLSLPQLFHESFVILQSIDPEKISDYYKAKYHLTYIHVYHNQITDLNDLFYIAKYKKDQKKHIEAYLSIAPQNTFEYKTVLAYKYYVEDKVEESVHTISLILNDPDTPAYVYAEFLFNLGGVLMESGEEEHRTDAQKYFTQASIKYNELAITKNPPIMYLAKMLLEANDEERAYRYISVAMNDAGTFSNSHRHNLVEKTHRLIQDTYYSEIKNQQKTLKFYSILLSVLVVLGIIALVSLFYRNQVLIRTRSKLSEVIFNLQESNHVKETYIGNYLNQYSVYINKLDEYRRFIIRKLNAGQYEELIRSESDSFSKTQEDIDALFLNFDNTFLELYPHFVENINSLLHLEYHFIYKSHKESDIQKMNTELRILALIKLGVTDNKTIASFLRITVQTVYNYRSKMKAKAINEDTFEEDMKKITYY